MSDYRQQIQIRARKPTSSISIPLESRFSYGSLKAFKGEYAEQRAFTAGMFVLATIGENERAQRWCADHGIDPRPRGAHKESSNELGGFLVPEEMESTVISLRESFGVFSAHAKPSPMASDLKSVPRRTSGLTAYFVNELGQINASEKGWDNVKLMAKKLACMVRYSSEISEDATIQLGDDFAEEMALCFAQKEDQCGFLGDGTSTYGGIVGVVNALAAGSMFDAAATHTSFETLTFADFEKLVGKLPQYAENGAAWYISKAGYAASMLRLMDAAGGNTAQMLAAGADARQFLGYPVRFSNVLNSTLGTDASKPKCILGDLRTGALIGRRRGMSIKTSEHKYIDTDEFVIVGTQRFDIKIHSKGTATEPGAILLLSTPAS